MKQHYVPKVYLKRFAEKNKNVYSVSVFDKLKNKFFRVRTDNVLAMTDLYTLQPSSKKSNNPLIIEKVYSDFIEPLYEHSIKLLLDDNKVFINSKERAEIIISILHLYHRNPNNLNKILEAHLENIKTLYNDSLKKEVKEFEYLSEIFNVDSFKIDDIRDRVEEKMMNQFKENHLEMTARFSVVHEFTIIEIFKSESNISFFTSDNPIDYQDILNGQLDNPFLKSSEFTIPLSKKYFLKLSHDKTKRVNYIYRKKVNDFIVDFINDEIFKNATRFVICSEEDYSQYLKSKEVIDDTSIHLKMNFVQQVIMECEERKEMDPAYYLLKEYYTKYLKQNKQLSKEDEYLMIKSIKEFSKQKKQKNI